MTDQMIEFPEIETDDPLAGLGLSLADELVQVRSECDGVDYCEIATQNEKAVSRIEDWLKAPASGEPLYLDLETIPDYSRTHLFGLKPLPTLPPTDTAESLMPADQFISQAVPEIEKWLAKHNPPPDWLQAVLAAEKSSKKPRKGFFDAVDDHYKRLADVASAEADQIKSMSVHPLRCAICCGAWAVGKDQPVSFYCGNDVSLERHLLSLIWRMIGRHTPIIGYGISFFDVPVILSRSMILKVKPTKALDRRKYGSTDIVDLCRSLFEDTRAGGLGEVCRSLGIESSLPNVNGSHVHDMWMSGDANGIRRYCEDDVRLVQRLHREAMQGYFCV